MDPFTIIGLSNRSTIGDVKRRYRGLALQHHPDKAGRQATARFQEINAAYETIIEEELYSRPGNMAKAKTDPSAGSTSSNAAGSNCRSRPQQPSHQRPTQASTRPRSPARPPGSPPRPTPQPPRTPPASQPPRPLSPARDDPELGDFVKNYDTLCIFIVCKVLFLFSFGYRRGWREAHQCFREFKKMLRMRASCFRLSSQLGVLVYIVKTVWASNLDGPSAEFVRGYSFATILSVVRAVGPVSITGRLLRIAENAFIEQQEEEDRLLLYNIRSKMSDADERLRRLYRRILSSISDFLDRDRRDHPDMRYSCRCRTMAYKLKIQLKYANISNEAGICSE